MRLLLGTSLLSSLGDLSGTRLVRLDCDELATQSQIEKRQYEPTLLMTPTATV